MKTSRGHTFGEAFMLMQYACKDCGHRETIWNSRDGVTPFGCGCPSCGQIMNHVNWPQDIYAPNHTLHLHQKFWRDGTPDEAEAIIRKRIEQMRGKYPCTPEEEEALVASVRAGKDGGEFQKGWPNLDQNNG